MRISSSRRVWATALCLTCALAACGGGSSGRAVRGSGDRVTAEELQADAAMDLFTLLQRRRPQWLQSRAPATAQGRQEITIILDGVRQQGSVEILRSMRSGDVQEVRYMNARDATTRYGTNMTAGAIEVITKRGPA